MKTIILNAKGLWPNGLSLIRILTGVFLMFHGTQAFETKDMEEFTRWLTDLSFPFPAAWAYAGKGVELLGGFLLVLGLFTRVASVMLIIVFCTISFTLGHGKIFTDAQHPFMFAMLSMIYLFEGPGHWSLDSHYFDKPAS